jgi:hypothetical protein
MFNNGKTVSSDFAPQFLKENISVLQTIDMMYL